MGHEKANRENIERTSKPWAATNLERFFPICVCSKSFERFNGLDIIYQV